MTARPRPGASVVMSAYGDLRFLDEAVDSVLRQDFTDFEFIIVDDGTGDAARFEALERRDPRIRVVISPENLGGAAAGNLGIARARSDIIVRLDADDSAEPTRVGTLVAALQADPELGLVGSAVTLVDEAGEAQGVLPMPETDVEIRWTILFHNPFMHPAVAFRRRVFEAAGGYKTDERVSYDHYMWFRMLPLCRARNLREPLTRYRLNPKGLTAAHIHDRPRARTHAIREAEWAAIGLGYDLYDDALAGEISRFLRGQGGPVAPAHRQAAYNTLLKVLFAFLGHIARHGRAEDLRDTENLARRLISRMLAEPPPAADVATGSAAAMMADALRGLGEQPRDLVQDTQRLLTHLYGDKGA